MKKIKTNFSVLLLPVCLALLTLVGCQEQEKKQDESTKEQVVVDAPEQIVTVAQAKSMYDNYSERRLGLIQKYEDSINGGNDKFDVARYTYYDYETIKHYMEYIEQEAALAGVEISTLRFYFSNYPDKAKFDDGREIKHPRQNSFFIMPTLKEKGLDYGFFTEDTGEGQRKAVLLTGQLELYSDEGMGMQMESNKLSYASFMPFNPSLPNTVFAGGSLILNEANSAPPPNQ